MNTYKNDSFYAIITHMESGENLNTDINNNNTDFETANSWGSLTDDKSESIAAFAAHALQKTKARERIEQEQKHSEPETPYEQQHKRAEQDLSHVDALMPDIYDKAADSSYEQILSPEQVFEKFNGLFAFFGRRYKRRSECN